MARYTPSGSVGTIPAINSELESISEAMQELLSKSGETPNQMEASLDMNGNSILNTYVDLDNPNSLVSVGDVYVRDEVDKKDADTLSAANSYANSLAKGKTLEATATESIILSGVPQSSIGDVVKTTTFSSVEHSVEAVWYKTGDTSTPSQYPASRTDGRLTDPDGVEWKLLTDGYVDPRVVGFTGSGDETSTLYAACKAAGEGGRVVLDKAYSFQLYSLDIGYTHIDLADSVIEDVDTEVCIKSSGEWLETTGVTSVVDDTLTLNDATGYSVGDVIKVTCTDEHPDFWTAGRYIGQFAVVLDIVGNVLTLDRSIYDDDLYLTDVTCYKLAPHTCSVSNVTIQPASSLTDHQALIELDSLVFPKVENVHTVNSRDTNISFISCYGYVVRDSSSVNSLDDGPSGNLGYGISDASCHAGYVENYNFNGGRHAWSNNGYSAGGVLDPKCGYTTQARISSSTCRNAQSGAWDTHPGALDVVFEDCRAYNSANFGQVRCRFVSFINPYGRGLTVGFALASGRDGSTINPMKDAIILNPDIVYTETALSYYTGETLPSTDVGDVHMEGGRVFTVGDYRGFLLEARNNPIKAVIKNVSVGSLQVNTDSAVFLAELEGHDIQVLGLDFRSSSRVSSSFSVVRGQDVFTITDYAVELQNISFSGTGYAGLALSAATNVNAYINDVRIRAIGAGSFTPVVNGTSLTWGGEV